MTGDLENFLIKKIGFELQYEIELKPLLGDLIDLTKPRT